MALRKPDAAEAAEQEEAEKAETQATTGQEGNAEQEEVTERGEAEQEETGAKGAEATEKPETERAQTTAVAKSGSRQMAAGGTGKFVEQMEEEGLGGLKIGFFSYPTIKLATEGRFETAEGVDLGKSVKCQIQESKAKWAYNVKNDDDKVEFSYDKIHNTKGEELGPILAEWEAEGDEVTVSQYLDVIVSISEGELEGTMAILSVAPSGVEKFSGYVHIIRYKGRDFRGVITEAYVGPKVTKTKFPFYPWMFRQAKD